MAKYKYLPLLKQGSKGKYVTKLQKMLGLKIKKYGTFGSYTESKVKEYQKKHGLVADGIVGDNTWMYLTHPKKASAAAKAYAKAKSAVSRRPSPGWAMSTARKKSIYGSSSREVQRNLRKVYWKRKRRTIVIHKRHVDQVRRAIAKIDRYEIKHGRNYKIRSVGTFNWRTIRGSNTLSNHAFGIAVDFNPAQNPMGYRLKTDMPKYFIDAWKSEGFRWGGNYRGRKDAMHWEA